MKVSTTLVLCVYVTIAFANENLPEVRTENGIVKGSHRKSKNGRIFEAFVGIPYAKPPVGDLRFEAPVPIVAWEGTFDASNYYHKVCPQGNPITGNYKPIGDEDCLVLNVYIPKLDSNTEPLPVIFYVHGGAFVLGTASPALFGPEIIMDKNVVFVAPNYRLGALGFLTTGDEVVPGNNGLKDQNLALKWVKNNIAAFGGDPNKITVIGHSAGAACAHLHMLSPLSKDLISGAIAQSGTAVASWAVSENNEVEKNSRKLALFLNCSNVDDNEEMVTYLRTIDAHEFVKQEEKFVEWAVDPLILFKPVVEKNNPGAFLPEHPVDVIKSRKAANVPFITGITTEDGAIKSAGYYNNPIWIADLEKKFNEVVPISLQYDFLKNKDKASKKIRKFYFGDKSIDNSTKAELTDLYTDAVFLRGADESIQLHVQHSNKPVYYYLFGYRGTESHSKLFGDPEHNYGVSHADELLYLFTLGNFPNYKPTEADEKVSDVLTEIWENFAKNGKPTSNSSTSSLPEWEPVKRENTDYYFIKDATRISMGRGLFKARAKFWNDLNLNLRAKEVRTEL